MLCSMDYKEVGPLEQTIKRLATVHVDGDYHVRPETRRNPLVPINRLPVELLPVIILLTASPTSTNCYPYLPYTWVCHHWRSVMIQDPVFWTFIRHEPWWDICNTGQLQFTRELIRRSKSAELDLILPGAMQFQDLFATKSHHIRRLWFTTPLQLDLSSLFFSSLRKLIFLGPVGCPVRAATSFTCYPPSRHQLTWRYLSAI